MKEFVRPLVEGTHARQQLEAFSQFVPIHDVLADVDHFQQQLSTHADPIVVYLKDRDPFNTTQEREIPVVAKLSNLHYLRRSVNEVLKSANHSGLKTTTVSIQDGQEIFVDRLSDFFISRAVVHRGSSTIADTIIDSNRAGDTVLYAMGYFYSTGTACGTSTPAAVKLLPGRYSFGIMAGSISDFDSTVWTIPTANSHVRLNKP